MLALLVPVEITIVGFADDPVVVVTGKKPEDVKI